MLRCTDLTVIRDGRRLFNPVSFELAAGEVLTVRGVSGLGKSTLLNALVMVEPGVQIEGRVQLDGQLMDPLQRFAKASRTVFQDALLFPHLSILDNVLMGGRRLARAERRTMARGLLDQLGLADLQTTDPYALSRGQMMRVSIARALIDPPPLLLLDEPFSALDHATRDRVRDVVFKRGHDAGSHMLWVTHDADDQAINGQAVCLTPP